MNPMHHGRTLLQRSEPPEQIAAVLQVDATTVALLSLVLNTNHVMLGLLSRAHRPSGGVHEKKVTG